MSILKSEYQQWIRIMDESKERMKRDKQIVQIISKMVKTKNLPDSDVNRLLKLLKENKK